MRGLVILLALAACGKGKPKVEDWSKTPMKTIDASTGGVAFSIAIPETWDKPAGADGWTPTTGDPAYRPSATVQNVSADAATSIATAMATAGMKQEHVVRSESKPDGYHLTEVTDDKVIVVAVFKPVGATYLWCTAKQSNDAGIASFERTKQALVKICESLAPK